MPRSNAEVAAAFRELADLTEIAGGDRFRVLAYRRVADAVSGLGREITTLSDAELVALRGVGKGTAPKIRELLASGSMAQLEQMRAAVPAGVHELTRLSGLGPKKALVIVRELGVSTLDELRAAIDAHRLRDLPGLGAKTEENLLAALAAYRPTEERILLSQALRLAEEMLEILRHGPAIERCSYAGSLRRMRETIGDLDLLAASAEPAAAMEAFSRLPQVARVAARGSTKSSVVTHDGVQVDLRVVAPDEWGAALQYFTGSKEHNVKVREHAVKHGFKLSEYGLFRVGRRGEAAPSTDAERVAAETEEEVYSALGMQTPPPTLRENRGEVELALRGELPVLVEVSDLRGDLQSHSTYSDGRVPLEEMARAAAERGYAYFAVTDHGRNLRLPGMRSLSLEDIDRQAAEVRRLNETLGGGMHLLHGVELNIGPDGDLDYPDEILSRFDAVVASVHHNMKDDRETMTRRILRAIDNPNVNIIGHPTGRRIGRRPAYELDLEAIARTAAAHGVALEINANPQRLDLKDDHILLAREVGCPLVISTDAHSPRELGLMRFGVATAQRGWVTKEEVINTWPRERLLRFLARGRARR
ncbi:MAG: DNA polymerase/3'-5' exonuclease PolX [Actinomycetota bacterium]